MSGQKLQQQQQQGSGSKRELEADYLFNQHIVRTIGYTAAGFGFGLATSLLFKHKAGMTMFFSGAGAGYGASNFFNDLGQFRKYKSLSQNQGQQYQRGGQGFEQLERKGAQFAEGLQNAKNQAKNAADQAQNKAEQGAQNLKEKGRDALEQAKNAGEQAYNRASEGWQQTKDQAKNAAGQAKNSGENAKDQAKNAAEHLQNKASEGWQHAKDQAKNTAENVKDQAKNAAGQAKNTAEHAKDQAKNAGENLKDQAKNAAQNLQNKASEGWQHAKDQAKNAAGQAKNTAEHAKDQAKNAAENVKDQAKNAAQNVQHKANEGSHKHGGTPTSTHEQTQRRIDDTIYNPKQQGKDTAGGTSANAGGDAYNRPFGGAEDRNKNEDYARKVAQGQQSKNIKAHGEGTSAQGDPKQDSTESVNGQTFQSFDSNTHKEGKAGLIHEIQTNYQENRNRFREQAASDNRTNLTRQGQDPYFKSETEGIGRVNEPKSDTQMGLHNYNPQGTESLKKNKIETDASRSEHGKVA